MTKFTDRSVKLKITQAPLVLLASHLLFSGQSSSALDGPKSTQQTNSKPRLEGWISRSEALPALDERLVVGAQFQESMLPGFNENNSWYQIPCWQSREYGSRKRKIIVRYDPPGYSDSGYHLGPLSYESGTSDDKAADALKAAEEHCRLPYACWQWGNDGGYIDILFICKHKPLGVTLGEVDFCDEGFSVRIDAESRRIIAVRPQEAWKSTYYPDSNELRRGISLIDPDKNDHGQGFEVSVYVKEPPWWVRKILGRKQL